MDPNEPCSSIIIVAAQSRCAGVVASRSQGLGLATRIDVSSQHIASAFLQKARVRGRGLQSAENVSACVCLHACVRENSKARISWRPHHTTATAAGAGPVAHQAAGRQPTRRHRRHPVDMSPKASCDLSVTIPILASLSRRCVPVLPCFHFCTVMRPFWNAASCA